MTEYNTDTEVMQAHIDKCLTLAVRTDGLIHYHSCGDEQHNSAYLYHIGFSWKSAIEIAAWAALAGESNEYEQNELPNTQIYIV